MRHVLSLVEKGWAGARQVSIRFTESGAQVEHLVRGWISREVLEVITPYRGVRVRGIPKQWYKVIAWVRLFLDQGSRHLTLILVDNERTVQWIGRWFPALRQKVVLVLEAPDGSPQIFWRGRAVEVSALLSVAVG